MQSISDEYIFPFEIIPLPLRFDCIISDKITLRAIILHLLFFAANPAVFAADISESCVTIILAHSVVYVKKKFAVNFSNLRRTQTVVYMYNFTTIACKNQSDMTKFNKFYIKIGSLHKIKRSVL